MGGLGGDVPVALGGAGTTRAGGLASTGLVSTDLDSVDSKLVLIGGGAGIALAGGA